MLLKKTMKGQIDLMTPAMAVQKELMAIPDFSAIDEGRFAAERKAIKNAKKAFLMVAGAAVQKYQQKIEEQQEVMMNLSDMLIKIYTAESALLRTEKLVQLRGEEYAAIYADMTKVYFSDSMNDLKKYAQTALASFAEGDELKMMLLGLKRFTKYPVLDTIGARRRVAQTLIKANEFCFSN